MFIYSEMATKFSKISTNYLSYVLTVKWLMDILQNFVAFSEYINFSKAYYNVPTNVSTNICDINLISFFWAKSKPDSNSWKRIIV